MSKTSDTPNDTPSWLNESLTVKDSHHCTDALLKYARFKIIDLKDLTVNMTLIKALVLFFGLDSQKWRSVNHLAVKLSQTAIRGMYDRVKLLLEKPDDLKKELSDVVVPEVCSWPEGML